MKLYFRDTFFSSGRTEIVDEGRNPAGELDLKSAWGYSLDIYGPEGELACSGAFRSLSSKWEVKTETGERLGLLKAGFALLNKKFVYETVDRGRYEITSPAFSKDYEIRDDHGNLVAQFQRVSNWYQSGAFCLDNGSEQLSDYELICVVMGTHQLDKVAASAAGSAT